MHVTVLGSAAGGGYPQWNCNHPNSRRARERDPDAPMRTQSSIAVSADGVQWVLFNASPDLRQQINDTPALHPTGALRASPIQAVVLTNADVDHVTGLLTLRESQPFRLYATPRVLGVLGANSIFNVLNPQYVTREPVPLGEAFEPRRPDGTGLGFAVVPFAVPGKVALWLEDAFKGDNFGTVPEDTAALEVRDLAGHTKFFYIPGCAEMTPELAARLQGAPLVFFDGTLWVDDEMIREGVGVKTGRRMGHLSVSGAEGTIAAFEALGVTRKIFIHINTTNPILIANTPERRAAEAAGWEVAYDGMRVTL
ncbi:MAG: pyrroloquinoline quinone biosynthesis protein PqqB [Gammaproteobacteria bacterium]|nr:pyrroloquinoline quinone biosynthesis protein PqqB [Gammaproteobacteria bacterium]MBI5618139.1 pyrroloquinoline quinone biosynthesis protein PqqB [Gammaproteobacteria bacterium]